MTTENKLEEKNPDEMKKETEIELIKERTARLAKDIDEELAKSDSFIHSNQDLKQRVEFIAGSLKKINNLFQNDQETLKKVTPFSNLSHELGNVVGDINETNFKWIRRAKKERIGKNDEIDKYTELVERFNFKTKEFYDYLYDIMQIKEFFDNEISSDKIYNKAA